MEGLSWIERSDWLQELGSGLPGWSHLDLFGVTRGEQIGLLEAAGALVGDFMGAWEQACRKELLRDPSFCGNWISGSAWGLSQLKPDWRNALHDRLVAAFLEPWLEAFYSHFGDPGARSVCLRWRGGSQVCDLAEARRLLQQEGLLLEMNFSHELAEGWYTLDWLGMPPVKVILSGPVREIRRLARPAILELKDCPDLTRIHNLDAGMMSVGHAPQLRWRGHCTEFLWDRVRSRA